MRKHIGMVVLALLVLVLLLIYTVAYQVSELTDLVVIERFGKISEVHSGRDKDQSGLHFKWLYPIEEEVRFDARTFLFEDTFEQTLTNDQKSVVGSVFCAWRIEDANQFLSTIKTVAAAEDTIRSRVRSSKTRAFARWDLGDLISTDPAKMKLPEVEKQIATDISGGLRSEYGVEVVLIGIKRLGLDKGTSEAAIETMKADRQKAAGEYQATGEARATAIRERARAARDKIIAFADRKAQGIKAEGELAAAEYYSKLGGQEDLAVFLRSLEAMRKELASRAVILLDETSMPFLKWFRTIPTAESVRKMAASQPAPAVGK